ncbi:MAG: hypothetical protein WKF61_11520 [Luteimonas sp.]
MATMMFAATSSELRGRCKVADLTARLRELRRETGARRDANAALFYRLGMDRSDTTREQLEIERRQGY